MAFQLEKVKPLNKTKEQQKTESFLDKELFIIGKTFNNKFKENFYVELSVLLKAGIPLKQSLELIAKSSKKDKQKEVIDTIIKKVISGSSFSEAIKDFKDFSTYEYFSIKIGEETGSLIDVSQQLGEFYSRKNKQKSIIIGALTYPIIIFSTALLVVIFMLQFVVPMFQDIFSQQKVELPFITQMVVNCSDFVKSWGWLLIGITLLIIFLLSYFKSNVILRKYKSLFILKIPYFGSFIKTIYLSQFTQAIALLTASKVPVVNSIQMVKQMILFYPLNKDLIDVESKIIKGESLSSSLKDSKMFDDKMIAMIKVAEETNQNEFIFKRLNEQYNEEVEQKSKLLSSLLEPLVILFIGIIVGFIVIAMYLPMFKMNSILG